MRAYLRGGLNRGEGAKSRIYGIACIITLTCVLICYYKFE